MVVGRVGRPHGIRGAFFLRCDPTILRDFRPGLKLSFALGDSRRSAKISECNAAGEGLRVRVEGIEDRDAAAALTGAEVRVSRGDLSRLGEGQFFDADLLGLEVVTTAGQRLGTIAEVVETGANDVYVVRAESGEILIPAVAHAVTSIDLQAGRVTVIADALEYPEPPRAARKSETPREPEIPHEAEAEAE